MIDSNFYVLSNDFYRLPRNERLARMQHLENTLQQLEIYRKKSGLKPSKIKAVSCLIALYDEFINSIKD